MSPMADAISWLLVWFMPGFAEAAMVKLGDGTCTFPDASCLVTRVTEQGTDLETCKSNCLADPSCSALEHLGARCIRQTGPACAPTTFENRGMADECWVIASSASVGGDPITVFAGVEYKFDLPIGQMTTLLQTKDLQVRASVFQGEAANEQWIDRAIIESNDGERIADVKIRADIGSFDKNVYAPGAFKTLEVKAPWLGDHLLAFPTQAVELVHWGSMVFGSPMQPKTPGVQWWPYRLESNKFDAHVPQIEGIVVLCDSMKFLISSASALEYYWDDADNYRALKYAHLDLEFLEMGDTSSFTGLLPEIWGILPAANMTTPSLDADTNQQSLPQHLLPSAEPTRETSHRPVSQSASESSSQSEPSDSREQLTHKILSEMLYPTGAVGSSPHVSMEM